MQKYLHASWNLYMVNGQRAFRIRNSGNTTPILHSEAHDITLIFVRDHVVRTHVHIFCFICI